jgi:hypothetical protein
VIVFENAKIDGFSGQVLDIPARVTHGDSQQDAKPFSDGSDGSAVHPNRSVVHALHHRTHLVSFF